MATKSQWEGAGDADRDDIDMESTGAGVGAGVSVDGGFGGGGATNAVANAATGIFGGGVGNIGGGTTAAAGFGAATTATARHAIFGGATGGEAAAAASAAAAAPRAFGGGFTAETGFGAAATKTKTAEAAPTQSVFGGGVGGLSLAGGTAQNQEPPVFGRTNTGGTAPPPGQSIFTAATQQQTRMGFGLGATTPADQPAPTPGPGGGLQERTTNGACTTAAAGSPFASAFGNKSGGKSDNIANVPQEPDLTNMSGAKLQRLKEQVAREESKRTEGFGWGPDPRAHGSGNGCGSHIGGDPNGGGGGGGVNGQEAVEIIGAITDLTKVLHGGKAVATMAPPQPQPQPQSQPREVLDAATGTDILDAEDAAAADCASPAFQTPARRPPRADLPWSFGKTAAAPSTPLRQRIPVRQAMSTDRRLARRLPSRSFQQQQLLNDVSPLTPGVSTVSEPVSLLLEARLQTRDAEVEAEDTVAEALRERRSAQRQRRAEEYQNRRRHNDLWRSNMDQWRSNMDQIETEETQEVDLIENEYVEQVRGTALKAADANRRCQQYVEGTILGNGDCGGGGGIDLDDKFAAEVGGGDGNGDGDVGAEASVGANDDGGIADISVTDDQGGVHFCKIKTSDPLPGGRLQHQIEIVGGECSGQILGGVPHERLRFKDDNEAAYYRALNFDPSNGGALDQARGGAEGTARKSLKVRIEETGDVGVGADGPAPTADGSAGISGNEASVSATGPPSDL